MHKSIAADENVEDRHRRKVWGRGSLCCWYETSQIQMPKTHGKMTDTSIHISQIRLRHTAKPAFGPSVCEPQQPLLPPRRCVYPQTAYLQMLANSPHHNPLVLYRINTEVAGCCEFWEASYTHTALLTPAFLYMCLCVCPVHIPSLPP